MLFPYFDFLFFTLLRGQALNGRYSRTQLTEFFFARICTVLHHPSCTVPRSEKLGRSSRDFFPLSLSLCVCVCQQAMRKRRLDEEVRSTLDTCTALCEVVKNFSGAVEDFPDNQFLQTQLSGFLLNMLTLLFCVLKVYCTGSSRICQGSSTIWMERRRGGRK